MDDRVQCGGGLTVLQRGARRSDLDRPSLEVGPIRPVARPQSDPLEAHRADHVLWRRHWSEPNRLVIEFVDLADVEVDITRGIVTFDRELPREMEQHLLLDHVLPLYLASRGSLVMHGAVVARHGRAVVIVGSSGAGKSTLTAYCWQQGWTVGGDDGAILTPSAPPTVEPTYPTIRLMTDAVDLLQLDRSSASGVLHKLRVADELTVGLAQQTFELAAIVVIEPAAAGPIAFEHLRGIGAHAELFGSTFHSDFSRNRLLPDVVDAIAHIVDHVPIARLGVPRGLDGLEAAEAFLRELVASSRSSSRVLPDPASSPSDDSDVA